MTSGLSEDETLTVSCTFSSALFRLLKLRGRRSHPFKNQRFVVFLRQFDFALGWYPCARYFDDSLKFRAFNSMLIVVVSMSLDWWKKEFFFRFGPARMQFGGLPFLALFTNRCDRSPRTAGYVRCPQRYFEY